VGCRPFLKRLGRILTVVGLIGLIVIAAQPAGVAAALASHCRGALRRGRAAVVVETGESVQGFQVRHR